MNHVIRLALGAALLLLLGCGARAQTSGTCNGITVPGWTTSGRPTTPPDGTVGYNSSVGYCEQYSASAGIWQPLGTVAVQVATVTVPSAQILTLSTKPVTIIPAPGSGRAIIVFFANYELLSYTVLYNPGGSPTGGSLFYGTNAGLAADGGDGGIGTRTTPNITLDSNPVAANGTPLLTTTASIANLPVVWQLLSSQQAYTSGDGSVRVTVVYTVVPI